MASPGLYVLYNVISQTLCVFSGGAHRLIKLEDLAPKEPSISLPLVVPSPDHFVYYK